jgi:hypothetical protein
MVPVAALPPYTRAGKVFSPGCSGVDGRRASASALHRAKVQVACAVASVAACSGASFIAGVRRMVSGAGARMYVAKAPFSGLPGFEPCEPPGMASPGTRAVSVSGAMVMTVSAKLLPITAPGVENAAPMHQRDPRRAPRRARPRCRRCRRGKYKIIHILGFTLFARLDEHSPTAKWVGCMLLARSTAGCC